MSQSNSFGCKVNTQIKHYPQPSKSQVFQWINTVLHTNDSNFTIQSLGKGDTYCKILNHYFPGIISANRIISSPLNEYQSSLNLRLFQKSLTKIKIYISFDIQKVNKLKFSQNWSLIVALYKILQGIEITKEIYQLKTPKRQLIGQCQIQQRKKTLKQNNSILNEPKKIEITGMGSILSQVQRVKQILIGSYNDTYKVFMIKKLFGIQDVKVEETNETYIKEQKSSAKSKKQ